MKRVAILGASGLAGGEVLRLLAHHPGMGAERAMSARPGHRPTPPELPFDPMIEPLDFDALEGLDGVFVCAAHGAAAPLARAALQRGCAVVDLSADLRLRDADLHRSVYGQEHPAPELLSAAVYGLTEHARDRVAGARLVANPGCYPTSILMPLLPLLDAGLIADGTPIIADAKSGMSGAGRTPTEATTFVARHDNFAAYRVGNHRHAPEIHQEAGTDRIVFVPHLLPVYRGILSTIYLQPRDGATATDVVACLAQRYESERFVRVYREGLPALDRVQRTNFCDIGAADAWGQIVVVSAIDNLVKGAAGQAIQNMNLMLDLEEGAGLS